MPREESAALHSESPLMYQLDPGFFMEMSTVKPTAVLGPALGPDYSHSIRLIRRLVDGPPGCPKINSGFADVRDVADLHLQAMTDGAAAQRKHERHERKSRAFARLGAAFERRSNRRRRKSRRPRLA